jgi:predicted DNA-binding protein
VLIYIYSPKQIREEIEMENTDNTNDKKHINYQSNANRKAPMRNYSLGAMQLKCISELAKKLLRTNASIIQEAVANFDGGRELIDEIDDHLVANATTMPTNLLEKLEEISIKTGRSKANIVRLSVHELLREKAITEYNVGDKQKNAPKPVRKYLIGENQLKDLRKFIKLSRVSKASFVREAIQDILDNYNECKHVDEIDDKLTRNITNMPSDLVEKLDKLSDETGRSESNLVRIAINELLKKKSV